MVQAAPPATGRGGAFGPAPSPAGPAASGSRPSSAGRRPLCSVGQTGIYFGSWELLMLRPRGQSAGFISLTRPGVGFLKVVIAGKFESHSVTLRRLLPAFFILFCVNLQSLKPVFWVQPSTRGRVSDPSYINPPLPHLASRCVRGWLRTWMCFTVALEDRDGLVPVFKKQ